ncbi:putative integral membrane protein [Hypoxylon cercidicola]|nr:putative integral membrane protein [Hypoxylon cercidicola]
MAPLLSETSVSVAPTTTFTPALEPPPGVISNPDHPASLVNLANISIGLCVSLITIFFLLRSYVRIFIKHAWTFEDVLATLAYAGTAVCCGLLWNTMAHYGGLHSWDITPEQAHESSYWFYVTSIEYGATIGITKLAVLWLYRRVFSPIRWSILDIAIVTLICLIVGFYSITTFVKIFQCSPLEKIWNSALPGRCLEIKWILNISGGFNTVTDYLILLLPIQAVRNLHMDRSKKVLVVLAFTFGLCAPIFATIGFVVRLQNSGSTDTSWNQPKIMLCGVAELASSTLCVCFPETGAIFCRRTRTATVPRRPTAAEFRDWRESDRQFRPRQDPYHSLMTNDEGESIGPQDRGNDISLASSLLVLLAVSTSAELEKQVDGYDVTCLEVRLDNNGNPQDLTGDGHSNDGRWTRKTHLNLNL